MLGEYNWQQEISIGQVGVCHIKMLGEYNKKQSRDCVNNGVCHMRFVLLDHGVMVAPQILVLSVSVRIRMVQLFWRLV